MHAVREKTGSALEARLLAAAAGTGFVIFPEALAETLFSMRWAKQWPLG
jgi:hypothetical protein